MSDESWKDISPDSNQIAVMLEGRTITSVESVVFDGNELFSILFKLDNGTVIQFESVAMHGMESCIQIQIPNYGKAKEAQNNSQTG